MSNEIINPYQSFEDSVGGALENGTVTFYANLTTTKATIYSDEALTITQSNPYTLDAAGRITGDVRFTGTLTLTIHDKDGAFVRTLDNVKNSLSLATLVAVNYAAMRALASSEFTDGQVITNTGTGEGGDFVVRTGTVTDDGLNLIVFTDDSNRYFDRIITPQEATNTTNITTNATNITTNASDIAALPIQTYYNSAGQSISSGSIRQFNHLLGVEPKIITFIIECISAEHGYSIGDRIYSPPFNSTDTSTNRFTSVYIDSTSIFVRYDGSTNVFVAGNKSSGATAILTNSSWELYVSAYA